MNEITQSKVKLQIRWLIGPFIGVLIILSFVGLVAHDKWHRTANGANSWTDCYHYFIDGGKASRIKELPSGKSECSLPNSKTFTD